MKDEGGVNGEGGLLVNGSVHTMALTNVHSDWMSLHLAWPAIAHYLIHYICMDHFSHILFYI